MFAHRLQEACLADLFVRADCGAGLRYHHAERAAVARFPRRFSLRTLVAQPRRM